MPEDFGINDRRGRGRRGGDDGLNGLRREGVSINRAREDTQRQNPFGDPRQSEMFGALRDGKIRGTRKSGALGNSMSMQMATSRPRDPMWYWKQNNIPINFTDPEELKRIREFCNTPDAPVTMYDGTTKPLGEVVPGDEVMGWDYLLTWNGGMHRRYVKSTVIAVNTRVAPNVVQLNMANGASVKCTADHKWHNPYFTKPQAQRGVWPEDYTRQVKIQTDEYRAAEVGSELLAPTNIQQIWNPGNLLSSVFSGEMTTSDATIDKVISIDEIGEAEVVSMQTTTGNYIVWGYCSRNCRLLNVTHPLVSACLAVYSQLPMQGLHFECKDPQLVDFYSDLFFDQLNYEEFLLDVGSEYWVSGESWALGGWNETLGIWEADQLINPDDVEVEKSLFLDEPRFLMRMPEDLRKILTTRQPHWQYVQLMQKFPELQYYASEDSRIPVSNIVLKQMRFKADRFSNRGLPILLRAMRTLIQEEMLNSALDSIADRLYTPLILTKLGAKAGDLGTNVPWIPNQDDMDEFNAALDAALAADFRALTYHWAIEMEPVFGRENVPDLSNDFDRIDDRILMVFGLSRTMLLGAGEGETYAADALNRDVVTQLLTHYQRNMAQFVHDRAAIVAEAQGHFDYEVRNGQRYLITEEIYEIDEETGEERIVEQPKLLVPELKFKTLNLSDEETERQFLESLAAVGVPVPYRSRLQASGIDFEEAVEQSSQERVTLAVAEQEVRQKTYLALLRQGLPIPEDLKDDFAPKAIQPGAMPVVPGEDQVLPGLGGQMELPALAPTPEELEAGDEEGEQGIDPNTGLPMDAPGDDTDANEDDEEEGDTRPEESDEEREDMPKKAGLSKEAAAAHEAALRKVGRQAVMTATARHYVKPDNSKEEGGPETWQPTGMFGAPKHIGMRRFVHVPDEVKVDHSEEGSEGRTE